ncbi:fumarylacetoacetate hydrolase family protein [Nocardioides sp. cx-173]|uniref:fumarylacetoacetate hydrolase family protein n=1 Tax=Nocardioides sp. cx-173 TaxID=2898796 RepID=UPI001E45FB17|nr:fumarylacetoacetate hydrolase family protein [Nocardioides sp. cx-173]MCD4526892.1 fumarylacetoacetate hydrolase family protein [Nocardioides sp. cx-173]UGB41319.1 fumarylacetoacetate hydrolase family protein [Nocardioides sp. cx-173]
MRLATIRTEDGTRAVRLEGDRLVDLGRPDLGALLAEADWELAASADGGRTFAAAGADFAPVVPSPSKVVCVGHNYTNHIQEMGRELPAYPTLFPKFADTLIGANDPLVKPPETDRLDWEVELTVVIGRQVRRASTAEAEAAIAGFTVMNDVSVRDWQFRTIEWTQGKIWDSTTPVGPYLVTPDELPGGVRPRLNVRTLVDEVVMQDDDTATLLFDPVALVEYVSTVITLRPGDLIATGTPAGVGQARDPQVFLQPGSTVTTEIDGIGACTNAVV